MPITRLINGEDLEYPEPPPEIAAFFVRLTELVEDPTKTDDDFISLAWGRENLLLDQTIFQDRGAVTKAVFANPLYHLMGHLMGLKRRQTGSLDFEKAKARFTMTITEAAKLLGVVQSVVRHAILKHRLTTWLVDGELLLDPYVVEHFGRVMREEKARLDVRYGATEGRSFKMATDGDLIVRKRIRGERATLEGEIVAGWKQLAVLTSTRTSARCWLLVAGAPRDDEQEIAFDGWFVRGRFRIVERTNNPREARNTFDEIRRTPGTGVVLLSPSNGRPLPEAVAA